MMGVEWLCCYITAFDAEQTGHNTDWARLYGATVHDRLSESWDTQLASP